MILYSLARKIYLSICGCCCIRFLLYDFKISNLRPFGSTWATSRPSLLSTGLRKITVAVSRGYPTLFINSVYSISKADVTCEIISVNFSFFSNFVYFFIIPFIFKRLPSIFRFPFSWYRHFCQKNK